MFLKRIELQGFKSFADKTVIQFDQDITGIVGPNGCGKSNVNDAIRWVLGEQSVKSLRSGTNMSDIIFSGSEYRKPVNMARVTLVFDNSTRVFDSDFDEIEITRQILRANNEASFFINKTPCRLKDINDLVMDTGLGKDSLSIITQGNISSFADAKPEDRRSLFEEAAGVAKYKKRKKVSLSKLEQTKENLDRLQDILDELERQIGPLEKQAKKAEKYISLRDKLSKIEISVLVEDIDQYNDKINQINKELFDIQAMHTSENAELLKQENRLESIRKEMYALDKQINELQGKYTNAMEENYQLERRKIEQDEKRKYMLQVADKQARQKELQAMLEEARFEYQDRHQRLMQTQQDLNNRRNIVNDLKTKISKARYESDQANNILIQLQNRRQVLENMMKQPFAHQQGVRSVMQAKNSLSGVYGVVSELLIAHVDKALAVNAALGGSIYQIITKNEADAELFGMDFEGLFPKDKPYLRWHHFKDIGSADKMYQIMSDELFPFIKNLKGDGESSYARFMRDAIFKIPTPNLLQKVVTGIEGLNTEEAVCAVANKQLAITNNMKKVRFIIYLVLELNISYL